MDAKHCVDAWVVVEVASWSALDESFFPFSPTFAFVSMFASQMAMLGFSESPLNCLPRQKNTLKHAPTSIVCV